MAWWEGASETRVLVAPETRLAEPRTSGKNGGNQLLLRHPKTGNGTQYLFSNGVLQELHWFKQPYGSWFLGDYVCEDGSLYTATPVDPSFILLPLFEEAQMKKGDDQGKFRQLDDIMYVSGFPGYQSLLSIAESSMQVVCDVKEVGSTKFFRLNDNKVLKWLLCKVRILQQTLPSLDRNYAARDEKDTLYDSVSIVGEYLKDEPWLNVLSNKLNLTLKDRLSTPSNEMFSPSPSSLNPTKENKAVEKNGGRPNTRQAKKAKVEKDSHNIKDMFSRATIKKR